MEGCVYQIFNLQMVVKTLAKRRAAEFVDLEKPSTGLTGWQCGMCEAHKGSENLSGVKQFYKDANAYGKVNGESFRIHGGVRQGCVMSSWLCNVFIDGVMREVKARLVMLEQLCVC